MNTPTKEQIQALGKVPEDLGGFQEITTGVIQLGDLVCHGSGSQRYREWAYGLVGAKVEDRFGFTIYRRMPVASHPVSEATKKVIEESKRGVPSVMSLMASIEAGDAQFPRLDENPIRYDAPATFIPQDDARRKGAPMYRGLIGYFPAALFEVAEHSRESNDKHNPGQDLQWARNKSADHADCIMRHLVDSGKRGTPNRKKELRALAWRALALLQEECEADGAAPGISSKF